MTKRTKKRCKNPCAFGSERACRMHGSHKSRNVLRGADHPKYKNGERTKEAEAENRRASTTLLILRDIGDSIGMFNGVHTRGRKPTGYKKYNMSEPENLMRALLIAIFNR